MKIAVVGANGQLGKSLLANLNHAIGFSRNVLDITNEQQIAKILDATDAKIIINCAAYTAVDQAESEPNLALQINALGPRLLAQYCEGNKKTLVQISSDYVFGKDRTHRKPYEETDRPAPTNLYGSSKLLGEMFVQSICEKHFIIRTCGLYNHPEEKGTGNFIETMLRLAQTRDSINIVNDQHCTPTSTDVLANAIEKLLQTTDFGTYHITCAEETTWLNFANAIFKEEAIEIETIPISTEQFAAPAERPRYSVLNCSKYSKITNDTLPAWKEALKQYLSNR